MCSKFFFCITFFIYLEHRPYSYKSSVVNVKSNCNNQIIIIFPNPAKHSLTVQGLEVKSNLQIIDAFGKVVIDVRMTGNKETLNITALHVGTHLLQVSKNNKLVKTLKFVKE